ncbi:MAG: helix-turn-helix domain-containing protein [Cyclobacteriaceae bacterium]
MEKLKYTIIKNKTQYKKYCKKVEELINSGSVTKPVSDEIDLLTLLIEKWDNEQYTSPEIDPIQLLRSFMEDHRLKAKDLTEILDTSKGYVSDILHYKKGLSKEVIRKLADYFKVSQEAFNHPYELVSPVNSTLKNARVMNTRKKLLVSN